MTDLSHDAMLFGISYLKSPKSKLSFGGDHAEMAITPRARAALNELLAAGYVAPIPPDDQWPNREHYAGTNKEPHLWALADKAGLNPFTDDGFVSFARIATPEPQA